MPPPPVPVLFRDPQLCHRHLLCTAASARSATGRGGPASPSPDVVSVSGTSMTSHSSVYVKMHPVFSADSPDSPYMNLLYSAVQRQGGTGSVETAMSPYLAMTGMSNAQIGLDDRVGLNLFKASPETGVDYLVKRNWSCRHGQSVVSWDRD